MVYFHGAVVMFLIIYVPSISFVFRISLSCSFIFIVLSISARRIFNYSCTKNPLCIGYITFSSFIFIVLSISARHKFNYSCTKHPLCIGYITFSSFIFIIMSLLWLSFYPHISVYRPLRRYMFWW